MLKVASYNIRKSVGTDWKRQPLRIINVINEVGADVIALQEVDRRFGRDRASSLSEEDILDHSQYRPLRFGIRPMSLGWHGNAILVKKQIEVIATRRIDLPAFEPRGAVLADVAIEDKVVRIVGMHLGLLGRWRTRQARAVLDYIETLDGKHPTVLMGDLNQWNPEGGALESFATDHTVIAPGPSFHSSRPMLALDRIITSRDFVMESAGVHHSALAAKGSDHLPIWAKLTLKSGELPPPPAIGTSGS